MQSSLPKLASIVSEANGMVGGYGTVADLLGLCLSLVHKCYIKNTQKHKMHLKLLLRAVTPELPQSSHLEHF